MDKDRLAARLRAIFLAELEEQLQAMNADLLALEGDPADAESLRSLFRIAHTLKGAARAAGVPEIEELCHALEALLVRARDGRAALDADAFSRLFAAADALAGAGRSLRAQEQLPRDQLDSVRRSLLRMQANTPTPSPDVVERPAAAPAVPESPAVAPPEPERKPASAPEVGADQVRVESGKLEELLAAAGQLAVTSERISARVGQLEEAHALATAWQADWRRLLKQLRPVLQRLDGGETLLQRLDSLDGQSRQLLGRTGDLSVRSRADARSLRQATEQAGERARRLRMRPFSDACAALPRAIRDLAAEAGKEVRLAVQGGEVEADREVLDTLRDVLLHLVRNAVDHGIEPPDERRAAGKPPAGTITVSASLHGRRLLVTVADDGAGIDVAAVRAQLERRGLPVPASDHDLAAHMFEAGFSTRSEASSISGRGVGLDVVRSSLEGLRGSVQVSWKPGLGTTFVLECPPSLASIRALLVRVGAQRFALPTAFVEHLARVRLDQVRQLEGRAVLLDADSAVPLASLSRLLGPPFSERALGEVEPVVRLNVGGRRLALLVDELLSEQEIVVRPLERVRATLPYLSGGTLLGSGQIALLLNSAALVAAASSGAAGLPSLHAAGPAPGTGAGRPRILVVDDSITTRTLEQSILEAAGYEVHTAVDGLDGWRVLQDTGCDLVVSDVEMPRLNGFELCQKVRASQRFARLPFILVTALESSADQARGLEVGADAYITKSSFDQQALLDTIRQLLG